MLELHQSNLHGHYKAIPHTLDHNSTDGGMRIFGITPQSYIMQQGMYWPRRVPSPTSVNQSGNPISEESVRYIRH